MEHLLGDARGWIQSLTLYSTLRQGRREGGRKEKWRQGGKETGRGEGERKGRRGKRQKEQGRGRGNGREGKEGQKEEGDFFSYN